ncbi:MAG: hypothetical protein AAGC46_17795, partial [Solirubrobacteraceae bacterium]
VHDRRRSEFVPAEAARSTADKLFSRGPWAILALAVAVPVAVAAFTGDPPVARVDVGPASTLPVAKWTSSTIKRPAIDTTADLLLGESVEFRSPDRRAAVTVGPVDRASGLAPASLGKGVQAARLRVAGGTVRQWQAPEKGGVQRYAVAATDDGAVAVVCHGPVALVRAACDHVVGALRADHGTLSGDPDVDVATEIAAALKTAGAARKRTLAVKDRTARAKDARAIATAYAAAAKRIGTLHTARPWDRDLTRLGSALGSTSRAFTSVEKAAQGKDRSRDGRARTGLREADASVDVALERLKARGYAVAGVSTHGRGH